MDIRDRHGLKNEAGSALQVALYSPGKLVLIHTGVVAAVSLLVSGGNFLLQELIASTGGLSGMGMRSVLSTLQSLLGLFSSAALPIWSMCYYFAVVRLSRRELAAPATLLDGMRNLGPVVRFLLIEYLIVFLIAMLCYMPSMILYLMTPAASSVKAAVEPALIEAMESGATTIVLDEAVLAPAAGDAVPLLLIMLLMILIVGAPVYYRLYMAVFALADDPKAGALAAMRRSVKLTKGNALNLFRIDLSFWWFYGLNILVMALGYVDDAFYIAGVALPVSDAAAALLFQALSLAGQMVLCYFAKNKVLVTHAVAYQVLQDKPETVPPAAPAPGKQPWVNW